MPWRHIEHRKERLPAYRLLVKIMQLTRGEILGSVDDVMIAACVGLGHAEARPMNATKIAHYLDMPRSTVVRRLDVLVENGFIVRVGTVYLVSEQRQSETGWVRQLEILVRDAVREWDAVHASVKLRENRSPAQSEMSKMDTPSDLVTE